MAQLLIHATDERRTSRTNFGEKIRRLLAWRSRGCLRRDQAGIRLNIEDAQGVPVFAAEDAGLLVDLPLPAGIYHVSAHVGRVRRDYTMLLDEGASVNLYLAFAADR